MDEMNIDSHKLYLHPRTVGYWLDDYLINPIYMEVSTSGACNHRCKFCALDYVGYQPNYLSPYAYIDFIKNRANNLKAIMFGGEGEPLMHQQFIKFVEANYIAGIDSALTTNGVLLIPKISEAITPMLKWIKISIDAGTDKTYYKLHGASTRDWETLWRNIEAITNKSYYRCRVGTQFLLLDDNYEEIDTFLRLSKGAGVNYAVIKTYSQHLKSKNKQNVLNPYDYISANYENADFKIIIRTDKGERNYERCLALPFWRYMQADGTIWACSAHLGDERFKVGHIHDAGLFDRMPTINKMMHYFDIKDCRLNCRMNNCNEYLWRLKHPKEHDNFI